MMINFVFINYNNLFCIVGNYAWRMMERSSLHHFKYFLHLLCRYGPQSYRWYNNKTYLICLFSLTGCHVFLIEWFSFEQVIFNRNDRRLNLHCCPHQHIADILSKMDVVSTLLDEIALEGLDGMFKQAKGSQLLVCAKFWTKRRPVLYFSGTDFINFFSGQVSILLSTNQVEAEAELRGWQGFQGWAWIRSHAETTDHSRKLASAIVCRWRRSGHVTRSSAWLIPHILLK